MVKYSNDILFYFDQLSASFYTLASKSDTSVVMNLLKLAYYLWVLFLYKQYAKYI